MRVTCEVSTKDRYELLSQCLLSVALQSVTPESLIIFDDSDNPPGSADALVQRYPAYGQLFQLFDQKKIAWQVVFGQKKGQHFNHQKAQEIAQTEWLWRIDDDEVAEPQVLEKLLRCCLPGVGAVAGLVVLPAPLPVPKEAANLIADLNRPNLQWFIHPEPKILEVEHLHSSFLYRRGLVDYELSLSPAAHREETLFTHALKRKGYKLLVDTSAVIWHFRAAQGGIRSYQDPTFWENDEKIFQAKLREWGVNGEPCKTIVLDCGMGDHVVVSKLVPELKKKYGKLVIASCYRDIFNGEEQISIAEAKQRLGNIENHNIYRRMIDWNWRGSLESAYRKLYELDDPVCAVGQTSS